MKCAVVLCDQCGEEIVKAPVLKSTEEAYHSAWGKAAIPGTAPFLTVEGMGDVCVKCLRTLIENMEVRTDAA